MAGIGGEDWKKDYYPTPPIPVLSTVAHPLDTNFSLFQPSTAVKVKDGSYTFHQENTEHSPAKVTPALQL